MSELDFDAPQDNTTGADTGGHETAIGTAESKLWAERLFEPVARDLANGAEAGGGRENAEAAGDGPGSEREATLAEAKAPPAEVSYEDFKLPGDFAVNPQLMDEFKAVAGRRGLKQQDAQALIDLQVRSHREHMQSFYRQRLSWRDEIKSDPDYGRERFDATLGHAKRGLKTLDPDGTIGMYLDQTGYGDNPAIIKLFARFSKQYLGEDQTYTGGPHRSRDTRSLADRLWPDMK